MGCWNLGVIVDVGELTGDIAGGREPQSVTKYLRLTLVFV